MDAAQVRLVEEALGHARLVGDDDRQVLGLVDAADGFGGAGEEVQLVGRGHVVPLDVQHPVAVEEEGAAGMAAVQPGDFSGEHVGLDAAQAVQVPASAMYSQVL